VSTRFYAVAFLALAFSIAALVLSVQTEEPAFAAAAGLIGAIGFFACYWMLKRER
jgi:hypothetical protein